MTQLSGLYGEDDLEMVTAGSVDFGVNFNAVSLWLSGLYVI